MEFNWLDHLRVYMYFAFSSIPYKNISNSFCDMILFSLFFAITYVAKYSIHRIYIWYFFMLENFNDKKLLTQIKKKHTHFPKFCKLCDARKQRDIRYMYMYNTDTCIKYGKKLL